MVSQLQRTSAWKGGRQPSLWAPHMALSMKSQAALTYKAVLSSVDLVCSAMQYYELAFAFYERYYQLASCLLFLTIQSCFVATVVQHKKRMQLFQSVGQTRLVPIVLSGRIRCAPFIQCSCLQMPGLVFAPCDRNPSQICSFMQCSCLQLPCLGHVLCGCTFTPLNEKWNTQ